MLLLNKQKTLALPVQSRCSRVGALHRPINQVCRWQAHAFYVVSLFSLRRQVRRSLQRRGWGRRERKALCCWVPASYSRAHVERAWPWHVGLPGAKTTLQRCFVYVSLPCQAIDRLLRTQRHVPPSKSLCTDFNYLINFKQMCRTLACLW